jgi:hypothetical protein
MAEYGVQVTNYNSKVVIDNAFQNFAIHSIGSVNLVAGQNALAVSPVSSTPVILFLRPSTAGYCVWSAVGMSGSDTHYCYITSSTTQTVDYLLLKAGNVNPISDYGVVFYDATGSIIFSSDDTYAKLVGWLSYTGQAEYNSPAITVSVSNTTNNYYLLNSGTGYAITTPNYAHIYTVSMMRASSTSISIKPILQYDRYIAGMIGGGNIMTTLNAGGNKLVEVSV